MNFCVLQNWVTSFKPFWTTPPADGPRGRDYNNGGKPLYYEEGFVTAQHFLNYEFMKLKATSNGQTFDENSVTSTLQRFPFAPYPSDPFILSISRSIPFIILICFIYLGMQTAKSVAVEKDSGLKVWFLTLRYLIVFHFMKFKLNSLAARYRNFFT